jgi:crotonobetainyl-CoA:carnitine CoA-transferase CaiB-like acyl-CoA transferase
MEMLDTPDLDTPENKGQPGRWRNQDAINSRLSDIFQTRPQAYWIKQLRQARIPCAPVNNLPQALSEPQILARNMVIEVAHDQGGTVRMPGNPIKLSDTHEESYTSPPTVGQHTDSVLKALLNKSEAEIADLREAGVI